MAAEWTSAVAVSVVSHGHGTMVSLLVDRLLDCHEVSQVIVTLNIPEALQLPKDPRVLVVENTLPKGFGANHNAAFLLSEAPFFCVLNPDVVFESNPFSVLLTALRRMSVALAVPIVVDAIGDVEDSLRRFMTPWRMLKRVLKMSSGAYTVTPSSSLLYPEWAAGMFMLFRWEAFRKLQGFDEGYFMYCEDADICTRLWATGGQLLAVPEAVVIHQAQRASRRSLRHLIWHVASMMRYMMRFFGRLPSVPDSVPIR